MSIKNPIPVELVAAFKLFVESIQIRVCALILIICHLFYIILPFEWKYALRDVPFKKLFKPLITGKPINED